MSDANLKVLAVAKKESASLKSRPPLDHRYCFLLPATRQTCFSFIADELFIVQVLTTSI